jgi:hypothetical protein
MNELIKHSESKLLIELGQAIVEVDRPALPVAPRELIRRANIWLEKNAYALRTTICTNEDVRKHFESKDLDPLLVAISECIATIAIQLPVGTIALLLVKRGLKTLCEVTWSEDVQ